MPAVLLEHAGSEAKPRPSKAPTIWEQLAGVCTEPAALFQRLATSPRWGEALWVLIIVGWLMMTLWGLKVDVDALQRPILEQSGRINATQIDQAIAISSRFIIPMGFVSVIVRNLFGVLSLGLVLWLFAASTDEPTNP